MLPVLLLIASVVALFSSGCNATVRDRVADDVKHRLQNTLDGSAVDSTLRTVAYDELLNRIPNAHVDNDVIVASIDPAWKKKRLRYTRGVVRSLTGEIVNTAKQLAVIDSVRRDSALVHDVWLYRSPPREQMQQMPFYESMVLVPAGEDPAFDDTLTMNDVLAVAYIDDNDPYVHRRRGIMEAYLLGSMGYAINIDMNASHFYQYNVGLGALFQIHDLVYIGAEAAVMRLTATYVRSTGWMGGSETAWSGSGTGYSITPQLHIRNSFTKAWAFDLGIGYSIRNVEIAVDSSDNFIYLISGSRKAENAMHVTVGAVYQGAQRERWYLMAGMFQGAIGVGFGVGVCF